MKNSIFFFVHLFAVIFLIILGLLLVKPKDFAFAATSVTHSTISDFLQNCATFTNTVVKSIGDGAVTLAPILNESFNSSVVNPSVWSYGVWNSGTYIPVPSLGIVSIPGLPNGAWIRSLSGSTYGEIEARAQFGSGAFQHIGFGSDGFVANRYLLFSTYIGDGNLYARVNNNSSEQNINLGPIPSGFHRYRILWENSDATHDTVLFFIDGIPSGSFTLGNTGLTGLYTYLSNDGNGTLDIDEVNKAPLYQSPGTYTSCVLDAGMGNILTKLGWNTTIHADETFQMDARSSADGISWGSWMSVGTSGEAISNPRRFMQYRITLTSNSGAFSPLLDAVTFTSDVAPTSTRTPTPTPTSTPTPTPLPHIFIENSCNATVVNGVHTTSNTGKNNTNTNTLGGSVVSGNASTNSTVLTTACISSSRILINSPVLNRVQNSKTGANSINTAAIQNEGSGLIHINTVSNAHEVNTINSISNTGENSSNTNTSTGQIQSGDAQMQNQINNRLNSSSSQVMRAQEERNEIENRLTGPNSINSAIIRN